MEWTEIKVVDEAGFRNVNVAHIWVGYCLSVQTEDACLGHGRDVVEPNENIVFKVVQARPFLGVVDKWINKFNIQVMVNADLD